MTSLLGLDDLDLTHLPDDSEVRITHSTSRRNHVPVAIIGMSGCAGTARNLDELWAMVARGEEGYRELSQERRADVDAYVAARGVAAPIAEERYLGGTRMPSVADFDYRFFAMSPLEAKTIDPHQRIFLETAWAALEDAGYLNQEIRGQQVGLYAGISTDFGDDYRAIIQAIMPDAPEISVAGNITSIIASRIAYLLDLKGPSMLIDTACSSGLVAAYTAYRAIQSGECSMAVAGAVNCDLIPVSADGSGVGINDIQDTHSADHHTRTFDRNSDGTSGAEGCFVFVLKALDRAQRDGDNIHAVILGGAVNQDGASNGITAPNAEAQADLIEAALDDAGVRAEQISFIEAHGTATRLGDPIEVSGIERAFSRQTSRKQFCGVGTVKTNIGHMDNAAGLAGLAKLVLSLKHRVLPASLNFEDPNPNITFAQTPVYVNDQTVPWTTDPDETLYAGINSFGLSGTNCHLVVRSADRAPARERAAAASYVLPLSAANADGLTRLVESYQTFVNQREVDPADLCFTASAGRLHHGTRAAFVFADHAELKALLEHFLRSDSRDASSKDLTRGSFRQVLSSGDKQDPGDITEAEREKLDRDSAAVLAGPIDRDAQRRLAELYVRGADIDWNKAAPDGARRISLPTYPFERTRCWIESGRHRRRDGLMHGAQVFRTVGREVCVCRLDPHSAWELDEHRIHGVAVLPGTGLVEMIVSAAQHLGLSGPSLTLRQVMFESPLAVADDDNAEIHVLFEQRGQSRDVTIAGRRADGDWLTYATAQLIPGPVAEVAEVAESVDLDTVRRRLVHDLRDPDAMDGAKGLVVSDRWTGTHVSAVGDADSTELLYELAVPEPYRSEVGAYSLHPALFDALINAPNNQYDEERLYLPFSYGVLTVHQPLPAHVFAHFTKRAESIDGTLYAFDVTVTDPAGRVLLTVDNYCVKSAVDLDLTGVGEYGYVQAYRRTSLPPPTRNGSGAVLLGGHADALDGLRQDLERAGYDVVCVPGTGEADAALAEHREFAFAVLAASSAIDASPLAESVREPLDEMLGLLELIAERQLAFSAGIVVLTRNASAVTGAETAIHPGQAGVVGMMRIAALEYTALGIRCLDVDERTEARFVVAEAQSANRPPFLLYRDGQAYEPYMNKHAIALPGAGVETLSAADGVTIISGGTGDLGSVVAEYLIEHGVRKLILVGSIDSDVTRDDWLDLENRLEVFEVVRVDLGDRHAVRSMVDDVRTRHGRVSGVWHLAGRPGAGYLYTKSVDEFMRVYRPKALGAVHLHEATLDDDLEFFVSFSSVAGLELEPGQSDYTAANLALDSLAQHRRRVNLPALSIQWPAWREVGMAQRMDAVNEAELFPPLDTDEAIDVLHSLLTSEAYPPVIMPGRMQSRDRTTATRGDRPSSHATSARDVTLYGADDADEVYRAVAQIWAETLDLDEVDAEADFGELGGNSLLTSQMLKHYDERYPGLMDITDLFRYTTISDQVAYVRKRLDSEEADVVPAPSTTSKDGDIDRLLDMLEQGKITVEESTGLL